ncbi:hypothetical protein TR51_06760 [Kitasatospora griseola]|uniref:Uncharacterized protein n=1 Tax=Kitasatospora griseola TaxID=2064 RepID=A0A0D0PXC5_KITGR|nr:hypothetical protein [Kitasatospora griseola]KIQ67074.1 hypothetical protein TR51_06760 [Kitasatospora griseola]
MSEHATGYYYVDTLRTLRDSTPIWGIRLPDGTWRTVMGMPDFYVRRSSADLAATQLNEANNLTDQASP